MTEKKVITAQAQGHNGPIDLEIGVENQEIVNVDVKKHSETKGIFNQVFSKLRDDILDNQSFDIDAISGATIMSDAILKSAKDAVEEAEVKIDSKKKDIPHVTEELHTDVVVIGGGEAGLVAGCRALKLGKKVILVEKNGYLGGATILNGSNVTATGSKVAKNIFGDEADNDTPEKLADDVRRESKDTNVPELTNLMANNIGDAIDFISKFAGLEYRKAQTQTPEHSVERQVELPTSSSYEFITKVAKAFEEKGGQILLDSRVEEVIIDGDKITGIVTEGKHKTTKIFASAVVLASGGYGANTKMRGPESQGLYYYGPMTSTGDAYQFLAPLQLKTRNLGWYKVYPHGVETEPGIAKLTTYASKLATDMGAIYVNTDGKRIVNESDVYAELRDAVLKQKDRVAFLVMDKRTWDEFYKLLVLHDFSESEIADYFAKDGKSNPILVKGSLQEVAQKAGIDVAGLSKTVQKYNDYAKQGKDEEFGRDSKFLHEYEGDEFYIIEQRDRFATTLGGFVTDADLHLQFENGNKLANVVAAGEVIGGANGHDSMPSMMNSWGISSGFVAGKEAAEISEN